MRFLFLFLQAIHICLTDLRQVRLSAPCLVLLEVVERQVMVVVGAAPAFERVAVSLDLCE